MKTNKKMAPRLSFRTLRSGKKYNDLAIKPEKKQSPSIKDYHRRIHKRQSIKIARINKEYDLEQKIDLEIKMREGTTKLLAACKHQSQSLEAAKSLLTSNERMTAYMSELQRRRKGGFSGNRLSNGKVSLSDLRIPLIWRDSDHFKNKGDHRRFAVFCLARIGTEIFDTTLLYPIDRSQTDLTFSDTLIFNNIPADFEFRLEVYSHILQDDLTIASTPRKIKRTIHSSISRTVGKKLAASLTDELGSGKIGPRFELMATARLTINDVDKAVRTHDLELQTIDTRSHMLPLFGHFCCRLAAQPENFSTEACSGDVSIIFPNDQQLSPVWARILGFRLEMWRQKSDFERGDKLFFTVPIDRETKINGLSTQIVLVRPDLSITLQSKEKEKWLQALTQTVDDHRRWKQAAAVYMNCSPANVGEIRPHTRMGSLYDQTPLIKAIAPMTKSHKKPTVKEIFGLSAEKSTM